MVFASAKLLDNLQEPISSQREPIRIELREITKVYPGGIVANKGINLTIEPGEILALLGENGAGKTTLVSIVAGHLKPTSGEIIVNGRRASFKSPSDALRAGIVLVPQHPKLIENYTVAENIGLFMRSAGLQPPGRKRLEEIIRELSLKYSLDVDPREKTWSLSFGEKQRVEILKALAVNARVLLLDEPTTHMTPLESRKLIALMRSLAKENRTIVFITHKLKEALEAADRIAVLRTGKLVAVIDRTKANEDVLLKLMFGKKINTISTINVSATVGYRNQEAKHVLEVNNLWVKGDHGEDAVKSVNIKVLEGEVLGIAGIAGNGQKELFEALVGLRKPVKGEIRILGLNVEGKGPLERMRLGVAVIPEERVGWALVPGKSIVFNIVFALLYSSGIPSVRGFLVKWGNARRLAERVVESMGIRTPGLEALVDELSGGNMQKLVVGRETILREPRLVIAMNPTGGLDYETATYVRTKLCRLAEEKGIGILWFSEDFEELLEVSNRIIVFSRGRAIGPFKKPFNTDAIAKAMTA